METLNTYIPYLNEARKRILITFSVWGLLFIGCMPFAQSIYAFLSAPATLALNTSHLIATHPVSPFLVPLKSVAVITFLCTLPLALYQITAFLLPAVNPLQRKYVKRLCAIGMSLFFLGMGFAWGVVAPVFYHVMNLMVPENVVYMPDIQAYLSFTLKMMFAFGLAFQIPILTVLIVAMGWVSRDTLKAKRRHVIVGAFVLGMLLTPPDVISQILLALPVWGLFECGILLSKPFDDRAHR